MAEKDTSFEEKRVPSILDKITLLPGDRVLWIIVTLLLAISLIVVYSSIGQVAFRHNTPTGVFLQKHIITIFLTVGLMILAYIIPAKVIRFFTPLAYVVSWLMTLAAYFFGGKGDDASRWLDLGFFSFQPSELLKIATIMVLAKQLSKFHTQIKRVHLLPSTIDLRKWNTPRERGIIFDEVLPIVAPIALSCAVILPAHTSSTVHLFVISMAMLFIAGIRAKEILKVALIAAVFGLSIMFLFGRGDTVVSRVMRFSTSEEVDYSKKGIDKYPDSYRSQMAVHNGGVFGVGAGRSLMRARLTHPESDYLFAVVIEEFGSVISFIIILLYLWIFFRSLRIFERCVWLYAGLLVVGLSLLIVSQAFLHIGVNIGILPETGQNLPFLTNGRTGMFCAGIAVGIILGISRQVERGTLTPPEMKNESQERL